MGKIRKMFPGAITGDGFLPLFDYIIPKEVNRIFCLKGGPGVGKSSFMKKIAREFANRGYDLELHYCSSDPTSLDGVVIKELNVVLLDATAPHIVEPKLPGAVDEIVNFGEFWDEEVIEKKRGEIEKTNFKVKEGYERTFKFLKAVVPFYLDIEEKKHKCSDEVEFNRLVDEISSEIFGDLEFREEKPYERHLYGSSVTPLGYLDYSDSTFEGVSNVYYLNGDIDLNRSEFLKRISRRALEKGYDVELYHFPLIRDRLQSVYIVQLDILFTTSYLFEDRNTVDLKACIDKGRLKEYESDIEEDKEIIDFLMKNAIANLKRAKYSHDEIEQYYIPAMDFKKVEQLKDEIINRILKYE